MGKIEMSQSQFANFVSDPSLPQNVVLMSSYRDTLNEPHTKWLDPVLGRLQELLRLHQGWYGYNGVAVTFANAYFTIRMLEATCGPNTPVPQIVPGVAGDLQIEWHTLKGDVELHVRTPNVVHAWSSVEGRHPEEEEISLTNDFSLIANWVKEITESPIAASAAAA